MKIALLADGIYPFVIGGMQKHSINLARQLVLMGNEVDLFHFVLDGEDLPSEEDVNKLIFKEDFKFNKVHCCYFPSSIYFPGHYLWNSYRYSKWIYEIIGKTLDSYDFIYAKGFTAWKLLKVRNKEKLNFKIGVKFHGYEMYQYAPDFKIKLQHIMLRPFVKWTNHQADIVFSYGGKITSIIKRIGVTENKIIELPSGVYKESIKVENNLTDDKIRFLFIGRNERRKGIKELFSVLKNFKESKLPLEFHFIGPIPEKQINTSSNIHIFYHGLVKDDMKKTKLIDNCDVLLCPSYSEGMPNVILEAMARGLAIIASDVGAISLLVSSNNGILIDKLNAVSLMQSIYYIIDQKNNLDTMKQFSKVKIRDEFIWDEIGAKFISLVENKIF